MLVHSHHLYACEHCGEEVLGGRYNNHCPHCLWSKHLDSVVPGDRQSDCGGLMEPIGATQKNGTWRIVHACNRCHTRTVVDATATDSVDRIIELSLLPTPVEA